ncbi:MAG: hypothetical protein EPN93_17225 [Spirochaetes bacterium]|nr:MAG: hypothetical protein EPN93_17225 [Spirochaetota bacterium]
MDNLLRCRACGYIMKESNKSGLCPACGVKRASFEPYKETVSAKRLWLLNQHLHGITVNFPQALAALLFLATAAGIAIQGLQENLIVVVRDIAILLPLSQAGGIFTGLIDGRTRFKRLMTPLLKTKMIVGSVALCFGIAIFVLGLDFRFSGMIPYALLALNACSLGCQVFLAKLGASMVCTKVPG